MWLASPLPAGHARNGLRKDSFNFHVPCGPDGETAAAGVTFAIYDLYAICSRVDSGE